MSRTDKDRPYWVRCQDPLEDRRWRQGYFRRRYETVEHTPESRLAYFEKWDREPYRDSYRRWTGETYYQDGEWVLHQDHCNCDDWCRDSRTRWRYGKVSKARTTRSMARQRVRSIDPYYEDPEDYTGSWEHCWDVWDEYDRFAPDGSGYWKYKDPRNLDMDGDFWRIVEYIETWDPE